MKKAARVVVIGVCAMGMTHSWSQGYPVKPVRGVANFSVGNTTDLISRMLATKMGAGPANLY